MSSDIVIRVENLSKRYVLGQAQAPGDGLRHRLNHALTAPFRWMRNGGRGGAEIKAQRSEIRGHRSEIRVQKSEVKNLTSDLRPLTAAASPPSAQEEFWALRDVSFDVKKGDIIGIIGRNGAGKSTLLKILSRITEPTSGRISIDGRVASLLEVGTGFHPELTGRENIFLNGAILGMSRAEIRKKFDEIVAFAEIDQFLDTPVKRYSSGMYVRLAFAVAAHLEPEILIIDEVLAVGDMKFQQKCLGKIQDVARLGRTVLFVSHQIGAVTALCSRAILLRGGKVGADGNVTEVVSNYIKTTDQRRGERRWNESVDAPGGEHVRITAVRTKSSGQVVEDVDMAKELAVELDFENYDDGALLTTSLHLYDESGTLILCTGNGPEANFKPDEWANRSYPIGRYVSRCMFPANFFNERNYSLSFFVQRSDGVIEARSDQSLNFRAYDTGAMRGGYTGEWHGSLRMKLNWETAPV